MKLPFFFTHRQNITQIPQKTFCPKQNNKIKKTSCKRLDGGGDYLIPKGTFFFQRRHTKYKSSHPVVFLGKGVLKICSKFIGE